MLQFAAQSYKLEKAVGLNNTRDQGHTKKKEAPLVLTRN